jgi:hypothetical protein
MSQEEQPKVANAGPRPVPRTWIDDGLDQLEAEIARRIDAVRPESKEFFKDFAGNEFARWVQNISALIETAQKANVINSFRGQYWVFQMNARNAMAEAAAKAETLAAVPSEPPPEEPKA